MALSLMCQWLFNFVIAKITPIMLADITYGTFLLFGSCCILMFVYVIFCVPETKGVPLESIHLLFEGSIVKGCVQDLVPRHSRAKKINAEVAAAEYHVGKDSDSELSATRRHKGPVTDTQHVEDA
jgi:hypothetical protein